jgi:hypothetical protein
VADRDFSLASSIFRSALTHPPQFPNTETNVLGRTARQPHGLNSHAPTFNTHASGTKSHQGYTHNHTNGKQRSYPTPMYASRARLHALTRHVATHALPLSTAAANAATPPPSTPEQRLIDRALPTWRQNDTPTYGAPAKACTQTAKVPVFKRHAPPRAHRFPPHGGLYTPTTIPTTRPTRTPRTVPR